jgi:hypothetical protein
MNARYQKDTGPSGKTRRSASAAKPKREVGGQAPVPAKKKTERPRVRDAFKPVVPDTDEIKRWARTRWWLIGAAVVVALFALSPVARTNSIVTYATFIVYALLLGGGILIDIMKIRPLREAEKARLKAEKKK